MSLAAIDALRGTRRAQGEADPGDTSTPLFGALPSQTDLPIAGAVEVVMRIAAGDVASFVGKRVGVIPDLPDEALHSAILGARRAIQAGEVREIPKKSKRRVA